MDCPKYKQAHQRFGAGPSCTHPERLTPDLLAKAEEQSKKKVVACVTDCVECRIFLSSREGKEVES